MIGERDWAVIERLQEGIPLSPQPFAEMAGSIGVSEDEFLQRVKRLHEEGVIRRLGPRVRHHRVGIAGNIMVVWRVPGERQGEIGELFAADEHVSHCYVRSAFAGFPYTLYTMIHGPDDAAVRQTVQDLATRSGLADYLLLPTVRELKKTSPKYTRPEGDSDEHQQV